MTIIAMILPLSQPPLAVAANVSGIKIKAIAADRSKRPMISSSNQMLRRTEIGVLFFHGIGGSMFNLAAFLWFKIKAKASGKKATGRTIAHIP
jgi:hypothetical protein